MSNHHGNTEHDAVWQQAVAAQEVRDRTAEAFRGYDPEASRLGNIAAKKAAEAAANASPEAHEWENGDEPDAFGDDNNHLGGGILGVRH